MAKVYSLMYWNVQHFKNTLTLDNLPPNYLFIGDLNTLGMDYWFDRDIDADHLNFLQFNNKDGQPGTSPVDVRGWVDTSNPAAKHRGIYEYSDHCYLYLEVHP